MEQTRRVKIVYLFTDTSEDTTLTRPLGRHNVTITKRVVLSFAVLSLSVRGEIVRRRSCSKQRVDHLTMGGRVLKLVMG